MKYNEYKKWYDRTNIFIIIISTVLSVFESFRLEVEDLIPPESHGLELFFNMIPIGISSIITCSAAIIKFRKYQEKNGEYAVYKRKSNNIYFKNRKYKRIIMV